MGSSGIIYAIIVGAWAVYLVPMWLRREDELNRARQTHRYAAAIKVLANKEAFERRWAQPGEAEEALPRAVGDAPPAAAAPPPARSTVTASVAEANRGGANPAPQRTANAAAASKSPGRRT